MFTTLAQNASQAAANTAADPNATEATTSSLNLWEEINHVFSTIVDIFSRGDTLANPGELIPELAQLGEIWALVFIVLGLICLLNGYKFHKVLTVGIVVLIGSMLGYWMGIEIQGPPFVIAGCVGTFMAVLALPLMKYAVAVLGGLSGAFIGSNLWAGLGRMMEKAATDHQALAVQAQEAGTAAPEPTLLTQASQYMPADAFWIGALIGLVFCGIAAFLLSKITIHLFTSVSGSTIAVFGVIALLLSIDAFSETVRAELIKSPMVLPLLVFVPAAIGFLLQEKYSGQVASEGEDG